MRDVIPIGTIAHLTKYNRDYYKVLKTLRKSEATLELEDALVPCDSNGVPEVDQSTFIYSWDSFRVQGWYEVFYESTKIKDKLNKLLKEIRK